MNIGEAIEAMRAGHRVRMREWLPDLWLYYDATEDAILDTGDNGQWWEPQMYELLADTWEIEAKP